MKKSDNENPERGSLPGRPAADGFRAPSGLRQLNSAVLFGGAREMVIEHEGEFYRLRCTSKGKLILTK